MIKIEKPIHKYKKCDSCYDGWPVRAIRMTIPDSTKSSTTHLCDKCIDELYELKNQAASED